MQYVYFCFCKALLEVEWWHGQSGSGCHEKFVLLRTSKLHFDHGSHVLKHRWKRFPVAQDAFCINLHHFASFCLIHPHRSSCATGCWGWVFRSFFFSAWALGGWHFNSCAHLKRIQRFTCQCWKAKWHKLKQERQAKRTCTWSSYATMFFSPWSRYISRYCITLNMLPAIYNKIGYLFWVVHHFTPFESLVL